MVKDPLCAGCTGINWPGPVPSEFAEDQIDVMFLGEAPGYNEVQQRRPMVGKAGHVLRITLAQLPALAKFGIGNIWACKPPEDKLPEDGVLGEYCKRRLVEELTTHGQRMTVLLGGTALNALSPDMSITQVQRRIFSVPFNGARLPVLACYHPSYVNRRGHEWRDWELTFDKLVAFLEGRYSCMPISQRKVHQAETPEQALLFLKRVRELSAEHKVMSVDLETTAGYSPWAGSKILAISIGWSFTESFSTMWRNIEGTEAFAAFKSLLEDPTITWLYYNGQYDTIFLRAVGINPVIGRDAMLEAATVDERGDIHSLKRDSGVFLDAPNWEYDIKQFAPTKEDSYEAIPVPKLLTYNGLDTMHTLHLSSVLRGHLEEEGELSYCERILYPTYDMLAEARYVGIRVDVRRVKELQGQIQPVMDDLTHQAAELTGNSFINLNSWQDKLKALRDRKLDVPNTRRETLEPYEGDELVDIIRAFMDASKILGTYLSGSDIYDDMRVHPDWKTPTENGRPRCADPNMLGMPRKAEIEEHRWKRFVKEIYVADPGTLLLHLDRRQSEVRCEVFLAKALAFIESLRKSPNADIHGMFTAMLYGVGFTKEQRVLVKMIVFGLIYNREAPSLARTLTAVERQRARKEGRTEYHTWTVREAQKFINDFFALFPELITYKKYCMDTVSDTGRFTDFFGRVRHFGLVNQDNRHHMMNQAVNYPPSSLSAGLNFLSCIETRKRYGKFGAVVLVPVHDSALVRIPRDSTSMVDEIKGMWEELAPKVLDYDIPFPCDVSVGERWSDL